MLQRVLFITVASMLVVVQIIFSAAVVTSQGPNNEILINGQQFFPIMIFDQNSNTLAKNKNIGINTSFGLFSGTSYGLCIGCQQQGMWAVVPKDATIKTTKTSSALLGWCQGDEPDGNGVTPAAVQANYDSIAAVDSLQHLVFLTLTGNFYTSPSGNYTAYCQATDVVGFDQYPIYGYCQENDVYWVGDIQDTLKNKYAQNKPTYQWIECEKCCSKWCYYTARNGLGPYPQDIQCEVWLAIVHGAKAIGYFPQNWRSDDCSQSGDEYYNPYTCTAEQESAMANTNRQITALTPVLCGPNSTVKVTQQITTGSGRVDMMVKQYGGNQLYIFAVNVLYDNGGTDNKTVRFTVPNLATWGSVVNVYHEGRTIIPAGNTFTDTLSNANPSHIYVIGGTGIKYQPPVPDPEDGAIYFNSPNPFTGSTEISYKVPRNTGVSLQIVDMSGRSIAILVQGVVSPGTHTVIWNGLDARGNSAKQGVYFGVLKAGQATSVWKIMKVK